MPDPCILSNFFAQKLCKKPSSVFRRVFFISCLRNFTGMDPRLLIHRNNFIIKKKDHHIRKAGQKPEHRKEHRYGGEVFFSRTSLLTKIFFLLFYHKNRGECKEVVRNREKPIPKPADCGKIFAVCPLEHCGRETAAVDSPDDAGKRSQPEGAGVSSERICRPAAYRAAPPYRHYPHRGAWTENL